MLDCEEEACAAIARHFILVPAIPQKSNPGMCTQAAMSVCSHMLPSQNLGLAQAYLA